MTRLVLRVTWLVLRVTRLVLRVTLLVLTNFLSNSLTGKTDFLKVSVLITFIFLGQEQAQHLAKLVDGGDFPHLLVYGPPGAGKKVRAKWKLKLLRT